MRRLWIALLQSLLLAAGATLVSAFQPVPAGAAFPALDVELLVNGEDADTAPGYVTLTGTALSWAFLVTNTGDESLISVAVVDDWGTAVSCPKVTLEPGESMTCTASSTALAGPHRHIATTTANGTAVTDNDETWYYGAHPGVGLETLINGLDADTAPGPGVPPGSTLHWTFVVTNTGDMALTSVTVVTDDLGLTVTCPKTALAPGESMTCTASSTAVAGVHSVLGTVMGAWQESGTVTDGDPAYYTGLVPQVQIETMVNGLEADAPPGLEILAGSPLSWTYVVTNTGSLTLTSVAVTDDQGLTVTCPKTSLEPGESMTCTAASVAAAGPHGLVGSVTAGSGAGGPASDDDPAWYTGLTEGCSPGYWKQHTDAWPPTGYSPSQTVKTVFPNVMTFYPTVGNATLRDALGFKGGRGGLGAAQTLVRAGTAALLDASHPDVDFPRTPAEVLASVNNALLGDRAGMLALAAQLDADNNGVCPLG